MDWDDLVGDLGWAEGAVRRMLVRALLALSQDFAMSAQVEFSARMALAAKTAGER